MRVNEREELKRQEDNPANGQYAFRSCVLSAGQIAMPVKRLFFACSGLSCPSGTHMGDALGYPSDISLRENASTEKILPRHFKSKKR